MSQFSDRFALKASRAQPVEPGTVPELEAMVQDLVQWAEVPVPRLYTIPSDRLAHLSFLRELAGVQAWLLHICSINDADHVPIDESAWRRALAEAEREPRLPSAARRGSHLQARHRCR